MSRPTTTVLLRPPLAIRIYVVAFLVFWLGLIVRITVVQHHHGSAIAVGVLFITFGLTLGYRISRIGVRSDATGSLLIRKNFGTRRLTRAQIEDFRIGGNSARRIGQRSIMALLNDGTVYGLDVSRVPFGFTGRQTRQRAAGSLVAFGKLSA